MEHDHLNKLSITFKQKDQYEIWWKFRIIIMNGINRVIERTRVHGRNGYVQCSKENKRPMGHGSLTCDIATADVMQQFSNPIIATNEKLII